VSNGSRPSLLIFVVRWLLICSIQRIGFKELLLDCWFLQANMSFQPGDGRSEFFASETPAKSNASREQHPIRSDLHRQQFASLFHRRLRHNNLPQPPYSGTIGSFSEEECPAFAPQQNGHGGQRESNSDRSDWVEVRVVQHTSEEDAEKGQKGSGQPRGIFQEDCENRWVLAADNLLPRAFLRIFTGTQFPVGNAAGAGIASVRL